MNRKSERIAVVELRKTGAKMIDIVKIDWHRTRKCPQSRETLQKDWRDCGPSLKSLSNHLSPTSKIIQKIRLQVQRNPERSMRKMASKAADQRVASENVVENKLKLRSCKIARVHFSDKKKDKR
ncbi:hypothetical protein KIN20_018578 [Parelaphostrongylus tenuis]|uniref:Uncharacterized protein n=1 Tax=Parelaphostrongylus tenuis TaxID=148309 RepID=A0AAD5MJQ9_PARTN|nr:hypothetical protein KIN20_018578 [Parelaphostrongylus tenuis]